jgi:hypothetical protein
VEPALADHVPELEPLELLDVLDVLDVPVVDELFALAAAVVEPVARSAMFAPSPRNAEMLSAPATMRERAAAWRRFTGRAGLRGAGVRSRSGRGGVGLASIADLLAVAGGVVIGPETGRPV